MIRWFSLLSIILNLLLMGCSNAPAKQPLANPTSQTTVKPTSEQSTTNAGQQLPITARAILNNGTKIDLEVARTPQQQAMGLMFRPALPDNRGMLFPFPSAQPVSFWMKNVPVALDMVFLRDGVVQAIAPSVPPCNSDPCPTYGPNTLIDTVLELRSSGAAKLGIKPGDKVKIENLPSEESRK